MTGVNVPVTAYDIVQCGSLSGNSNQYTTAKKKIIKNKIKNNDIWSSTENKMWNPYFGAVDNKVTYNS